MKATNLQKRKTVEVPQENTTTVKKPTSRASGRCNRKTAKNDCSSIGDVPAVLVFPAVQVVDPLSQGAKQVQEVKSTAGLPFEKIKMQLFPIDEGTRIGLEKDGHNPYLELTLRARKKISSVLKHLNSKWGSSSVAVGDVTLFPYSIQLENLSTHKRWSINDESSCAGDVYADIGSPPLFRLRYGWFSNLDSRISKMPPRTTVLGTPFKSQGLQKSCGRIPLMDRNRQLERSHDVFKPSYTSKTENIGVAANMPVNVAVCLAEEDKNASVTHPGIPCNDSLSKLSMGWLLSDVSMLSNINNCNSKSKEMEPNSQPIQLFFSDISIGGLLSEASVEGIIVKNEPKLSGEKSNSKLTKDNNGVVQSPVLWDDSFTTLSIGGLLSEASLQAKIYHQDKPGLQRTQGIFDSLDAFNIDGIKSQTQTSKSSTQVSHSSILDAEETCHAFSFGRSSLPEKCIVPLGGSSTLTNRNNIFELNTQSKFAQDHSRQESKTGLLASPRFHENSLGLEGIQWNESLGPFDMNFPAVRQIKSEDSVSISEFVR